MTVINTDGILYSEFLIIFLFHNKIQDMKNLLPHFIAEMLSSGKFEGDFNAVVMHLDITGFTPMTEKLMEKGNEGAEILAKILNRVFDPLINTIHLFGGFVSGFAGDAFTVIFKGIGILEALSCSSKIRETLGQIAVQNTRFGTYELSFKISLSSGNVDWGILGDRHRVYYFRGEAIKNCIENQKFCEGSEIVIDDTMLSEGEVKAEIIRDRRYRLTSWRRIIPQVPFSPAFISGEIASIFFPEQIFRGEQIGEFRKVVAVFISIIPLLKHAELDRLVKDIIGYCDDFGGYFNRIEFGDKGGVILIIFGAPVYYEGNIRRSVDFIKAVKASWGEAIKAGMTSGMAFTGFTGTDERCEYTALSDTVNQAARFMSRAPAGEIWVSRSMAGAVSNDYKSRYIGRMIFKGKSTPIPVYRLMEQNRGQGPALCRNKMIGRQDELKILKESAEMIYAGRFGGITIIYGEAGIGKSRLLEEFSRNENAYSAVMQSDSLLKTSFNPLRYFALNYFRQSGKSDPEQFNLIYGRLLKGLKKLKDARADNILSELVRLKPVISAQLGLDIHDSYYSSLDSRGRYENTVTAYNELLKGLSLLKPLIICIEDIQYLDEGSQDVLRLLCRSGNDYPFMIAGTGRFSDDGGRPVLNVDKEIIQREIVIDRLNDKEAESLINEHIKADEPLKKLIISKAENNPFYLEQIIQYIKENRLMGKALRDISIPESIYSIIIARIDRLETDLKQIVKVASVLGREFEIAILMEIIQNLSLFPGTAQEQEKLEQLENKNIWMKLSLLKYMFKHALLQKTAYEMQLKSMLRKFHSYAARAIEGAYKDTENKYYEIAYHYYNAEEKSKAIEYYNKSAVYFKKRFENQKALECFDALLQMCDENEKVFEYNYYRIDILDLTGRTDQCMRDLKVLIKKAKDMNSKIYQLRYQNQLIHSLHMKGEMEEAYKLCRETIELAEQTGNKNEMAISYGNMGKLYFRQNKYDEARQYFMNQLNSAQEAGDMDAVSSASGNMGNAYVEQGKYDKAMEYFKSSYETALKNANKRNSASALGSIGRIYSNTGDMGKALKYYLMKEEISKEIGDKGNLSTVNGNLGILYHIQGYMKEALARYEKAKTLFAEIGDKLGLGLITGNIGVLYYDMDRLDEALINFEIQLKTAKEIGNKKGIILSTANIGKTLIEKGDFKKSLEYMEESRKIAEEIGDRPALCEISSYKALLYKQKGSYKKSIELYKASARIAEELGDYKAESFAYCNIASIYRIINDLQIASRYIDKSVKLSKKVNVRYDTCALFIERAKISFESGDYETAVHFNSEAQKIAQELANERFLLDSQILLAKINALSDKKSALNTLRNLIKNHGKDLLANALANYEIYILNGSENCRAKALKGLDELYTKSRNHEYKLMIDRLKINIR